MANTDGVTFEGGNWDDSGYSTGNPEGVVFEDGDVTSGTNVLTVESELRTRDTLPEGFQGKLTEGDLALIDCGEMVYVPSLKTFLRRGRIQNPPARPEGKLCPGEGTEAITLNDSGGVVVSDQAAAAAGAAGDAVSAAFKGTGTTTEETTETKFCGTEERVSTHTCNSQYPATAIDRFGNVGVVWHDTRDGVHEIYFRALASKLSQKDALEIMQAQANAKVRLVNLNCFEPDKSDDPTKLVEYESKKRCSEGGENSGVLVRGSNGRLDVNVNSRTITLSAEGGDVDFVVLGIQTGAKIRIENGNNSGLELLVSKVLSPVVLEANYVDSATSGTGFTFSILENPAFSLTSCETRLTCNPGMSVFPDVVVDSDGRYHVVYQSNEEGTFQLYYIQLAPKNVGIKDRCAEAPPLNKMQGFGEVEPGTPGSFVFTDLTNPEEPVERAFVKTGENGDFFSYGNRFLVLARPNDSPIIQDRTGIHKLFRDFAGGGGRWTGISMSEDRVTWNSQISLLGQSITPEVVFATHPIAKAGDFGGRYTFRSLAFMAMTPPDAKVRIRNVSLPLVPRCSPRGFSTEAIVREQDLVSSPKRPMPPSFVDPVDLSQIMSNPNLKVDDSLPSRFVLENDPSGVIYTNLIQEDARGQFWRLYFRKDTEKDTIKFLLGQQRCDDEPCGVKVPDDVVLELPTTPQYKITLEVWQGSDYRLGQEQAASSQMAGALLFQKEFPFDASEEISSFPLEDGELTLPEGSFVFFVPKAGENTEFMTQGVGVGNDVWGTSSDGLFERFAPPYTLKPFSGLKCPVYYEGFLQSDLDEGVMEPKVGENVINTRTAASGASVAFGNIAGTDDLSTADVVSQGFAITEDRKLVSVIIRMAKGSAAGLYDNGEVIPADVTRNLLVELFDDDGGLPNSVVASVVIPNGDLIAFDDSTEVPTDSDLGNVTISFNKDLAAGTYHVVFREEGDVDKGGRFWVITDVNNTFPVGPGLWNTNRSMDRAAWRLLPGQVQLMVVFEEQQVEQEAVPNG